MTISALRLTANSKLRGAPSGAGSFAPVPVPEFPIFRQIRIYGLCLCRFSTNYWNSAYSTMACFENGNVGVGILPECQELRCRLLLKQPHLPHKFTDFTNGWHPPQPSVAR